MDMVTELIQFLYLISHKMTVWQFTNVWSYWRWTYLLILHSARVAKLSD